MSGSDHTERGFTLTEVLVSMVALVPILIAILSTRDVVDRAVQANDARADVSDQIRRVARSVQAVTLPALISTVRVRATQADVQDATHAEQQRQIDDPMGTPTPVPSVGDWIAPRQRDPRPNLRFVAADGRLAINASALTAPRNLEFAIDANELANGLDDDGDGLVDEGRLVYEFDSQSVVLADGVERCTFSIDSGTLELELATARRDPRGRVFRAATRQSIRLRNN